VHRVVVAPAPEGNGALLGAVHATRRETIESDDHVEITGLIVHERARGTGVGTLLVAAAERWARDLGLRAVRLRSNVVREEAHAFYRHLGYRVLKQQVAFVKEL
jgi:GNAT superfamily N-acetyltransferase